ncbi:4-hydroxy-tetrahydrodipicolinate synthase [Natronospirillum operosum]|uniref:4-hydroxy-tetrahydrodipicolinate synthase n=1 Tax=Natronospirillum operosum TaxID=2759953 RepID=A0A4Z0WBJ8_9GAMM|nr:4-hydroxy-tetrahydrodipicolinate synthase [Natronospirillum operosum]TGG93915.1 4-hydroxy-tetrahydrodipicolinate synthase [Natronospirillum operosum]
MIKGSTVALVTPMNQDGSISWESLEQLLEFHIENGTQGIVSVGTTGESATLTMAEHKAVIKFTADYCRGRIPVLAGTGSNNTMEAVELTKTAAEAGANLTLSVVPYYNKPSQEGLYQHFKTIAEAVDLPLMLYNVPGRTVTDMSNETVARLARIPNIIGIKDASADISRVQAIKAMAGQDFAMYSGDDATSLDFLLAGGDGVVSVTTNVSPRAMQSMCMAAIEGNRELAERLDASLQPLHKNLFLESNPVPVKWALNLMGLIPPGIRLPLVPLAEQYHDQVRQALIESGVL